MKCKYGLILFPRKELISVPYRIEDAIEQPSDEDDKDTS